jgi:hypothetical protein
MSRARSSPARRTRVATKAGFASLLKRYDHARKVTEGLVQDIAESQSAILRSERKGRLDEVAQELQPRLDALSDLRQAPLAERSWTAAIERSATSIFPGLALNQIREPDWAARWWARDRPRDLPPWPPTLTFSAPYSSGSPLIEYTLDAQQPYHAPGLVEKTTWSIPYEGKLSLGAGAGRLPGLGTSPLPDRWRLGDALIVNASINQVADIGIYTYESPRTLTAAANVSTLRLPDSPYQIIYCWPGLASGIAAGTIAVVGSIWVSVGVTGSPPVSAWKDFLYAVFHGLDDDGVWMADQLDFSPSVEVDVSMPVAAGTQFAFVTVTADILCLRVGADDPAGGFVGIDLRDDRAKQIFDPDPYWMKNTPLKVDAITVYLTP